MKYVLTYLVLVMASLCLVPPVAAQAGHAEAHSATQSSISPDQVWNDLMDGNHRFVAGKAKSADLVLLRQSLAKGQHPKAIVLSCSDSRVSPEILFDQSLGDLFVVRTAGNTADALALGSMEYAFEHLGSNVLIVLGHTKCGAVTAACSGEKMPSPNLQALVDKIMPATLKVKDSAKGDALIEAAVKENVRESAQDVLTHSEILHAGEHSGKLAVFEAEYHLDTGEVVLLDKMQR